MSIAPIASNPSHGCEALSDEELAAQACLPRDELNPATAAKPEPKKDWCGSTGTGWVPEGALGVDWSDACKTHDECYDKPGANKDLCDYSFSEDVSLACAAQGGGMLCHIIAGIYRFGVDLAGGTAFENAQIGGKH